MHEVNVPKSSLRGPSFAPKRAGCLHPDGGPTGVFRYRGEEFIAIMVMPYQWSQMITAINMPELADDPRFNTARPDDRNEIAADRLGEHNEEVLRELLSLTDKKIAGLYADKVIVRDPLLDPSGGRQ
jgi:crotonobetainyl-CoA:carnitine CoA-transferase CaiB-like acyl-CoA transferase